MSAQPSFHKILDEHPSVREWLHLLSSLGRAPATLDAYGRGVAHYLVYCRASKIAAEKATLEQVALYIGSLLPGRPNSIANSSLHQRLTAIRLWYDHLVFQGLCAQNSVLRGQYSASRSVPVHAGFTRGLVPRLVKLPHVPTDEEWQCILRAAAEASLRDRLMLALGYYGALRRSELMALRISDLDFAHRLISVRAETTKGKRSRIVCYSPAVSPVLAAHLQNSRLTSAGAGPLFRSVSDRNCGEPLSKWSWSKTVSAWAAAAEVKGFSTHTLRHLRLTHLARAGWKLQELATYAGHRDPKTTLVYLHLSGTELAARIAGSIAHLDARMDAALFPSLRSSP